MKSKNIGLIVFIVCIDLLIHAHTIYASRTALIIGNQGYQNKPLEKTINDAKDMAMVLRNFGFEVLLYTDTDYRTMKEAIRLFGNKLQQNRGVGLFYYSGHGFQYNNRNYLIPVRTDVRSEADIEYETIPADYILSQMEQAQNEINIVILDACRNTPWTRSFTRSIKNGLTKMDAPGAQKGGIIAFATAPGQVAYEGEGRNGIFTKHLLEALKENSQKGITELFLEVNKSVKQETNGEQSPWEHYSLTEQFCFGQCTTNEDSIPLSPLVTPSMVTPMIEPEDVLCYDDQAFVE